MVKERETWIDVLKGIAIIFVVLGHVVTSYRNSDMLLDATAFNYAASFAYAFHMPLFFVLSGYLAGKSPKQEPLGTSVLSKCISYGIPYVIFSVVTFVLKALAGSVVNDQITFTDLLMILLYPVSFLWFLYALLLISIVSLLLKHWGWKKRPVILAVSLLVNILGKVLVRTEFLQGSVLSGCILFYVLEYYFWYALGEYLSEKLKGELKQKLVKVKVWAIILLLGLFAGVVYFVAFHYEGQSILLNLAISFWGVGIFLLIGIKLSRSRALEYLGKQTLPVYLLHGYVISFVRVLLTKLNIPLLEGLVPMVVATLLGVVLPLTAYLISTKIKGLDFIFYPQRYLRISKRKNTQ